MHNIKYILILFFGCCLTSCSAQITVTAIPDVIESPIYTATLTPTPTITYTPQPSPTLTSTLIPPFGICSPLKGIDLEELHLITTQKFIYPSVFTDTGHPAVDLGFFTFKDFSTMRGLPVQSILPGRVIQVIDDRFPYGNMIMIETPLKLMSAEFTKAFSIPTPIPEDSIQLWSTCSKEMAPILWTDESRSIYLLYAHLENKPAFQIGDWVDCGQIIGTIGITGNSVAEHLHLEVRVGPSSARFGPIGSFLEDMTREERYNYCIWSISGHFQAVDPELLWQK